MRVLLSRFVIAAAAPPLCGKCHFASAVRTLALGSGCPGSAALRLSGRACCEGTGFMEATVAILPLWLRRDPICHWRTSFQPRPPQFGALWIAGCVCSCGRCFATRLSVSPATPGRSVVKELARGQRPPQLYCFAERRWAWRLGTRFTAAAAALASHGNVGLRLPSDELLHESRSRTLRH